MAEKAIGINLPAGDDPNISADDHAALFHALAGAEGILGFGITCAKIDDNTVRLTAGDVLVRGHQHRVVGGATHDLTFTSGTLGYNRYDLVVAQFVRTTDEVEDPDTLEFAVVEGTPSVGTASDPTLTQQDINTSTNTTRQVPLYRIGFTGTTMGPPVQVAHNIENLTGWIPITGKCTQVSPTSFTTVGDVTGYIGAGDPLKWYQSSVVQYANVASTSYSSGTGLTTITTVANSGYSVLNLPIDRPYFAKAANPAGFPYSNIRARAYLNSAQDNITDNTYTKVLLDAETYDTGANFTSNKFTAPISGYYQIYGQVAFVSASVISGKRYGALIYVNGSAVADCFAHSGIASMITPNVTTTQYLTAGQYIELYTHLNVGANTVDVSAGTYLTYLEVSLVAL